ncbi:MAG TPA: glycosyltransferase, partial [Candidatus Eisenbacteria bacterium]|nr:glycosyltransferase [Candidatus Eisenbacteria bacterium]
MFPRITETFVLNEVLALRRRGVPLRIYSLLPPVRDVRIHPEAEALLDEVWVVSPLSWRSAVELGSALKRLFQTHPFRTASYLLGGIIHLSPGGLRNGIRGLLLADRLLRDDVAHVHAAWAHTPATVTEAASRLTGIPWSMAAHAKDIFTSRPESLARRMGSARFTLACSTAHAEHLRTLAARHGPPGRVPTVILAHHGVDADFFAPGASPVARNGVPRIVSIGRLVPKKGMDQLVLAAARLRDRGVSFHLDIVGEGPLRGILEREVRERGLTNEVRLTGLLVREEVREALRGATCFALACRVDESGDRDGVPNAIAEAMACGTPVVATRLPGIEELVADGCGTLVAPGDVEALGDALESMIREPGARDLVGARARARILEVFDARRCEAERTRILAQSLSVRRILYVSADRGVPVGGVKGASVHVRSLVRALHAKEVESAVVTTNAGRGGSGGSPIPFRVVEARAQGTWASAARAMAALTPFRSRDANARAALERAFLRLADNVALFRSASDVTGAWSPDAVYERYSLCAVAGSVLARRLAVPHVLEMNAPLADEEARHRGLALPGLTRAVERWILRRADRVLVVSEALRVHAEQLGAAPDRIRVVPNGVDPELFRPDRPGTTVRNGSSPEDAVWVGFSGSLKPWHGTEHLVRALATASREDPRLRLLVLGEGPERGRLRELACSLAIEDRIEFAGAVAHERVPEYLASCDILSAPYGPTDDFYFSPLKIAEYRAAGKPVVASRVGDLARTLDEAAGVVLLEPGDEQALARTLVDLARDPETRARLGRAAAAQSWTWSHVADATLEAIDAARPACWRWATRRPLTIGYVVKMFPRFSETFIVNEILEVERLGVNVVVFSMKENDETIRQPAVARVRAPVRVLPAAVSRFDQFGTHAAMLLRHPIRYGRTFLYVRSRGSESAWSKFRIAPWLAREAHARGVHHLHAHFASGPARQAKFASMLSGIPFSFTAHAKDLYWSGHRHEDRHKLKKRLQLASFVVAISHQNRRFLENRGFHVPRRKVVTIHNGIDLAIWTFRRPQGRPVSPCPGDPVMARDETPTVLAVGRLVEKKGFGVLIDAMAVLLHRGMRARAWIVGDGPERGR